MPRKLYSVGDPLPAGHIIGAGAVPAISSIAGISAVDIDGSDIAGTIEFTVGASPLTATDATDVIQVTFASTYTAAPYVVISPGNEAASILGFVPYVASTTNGFGIKGNELLPFVAGMTFVYNYMVVQ